MSRRTIMLSTWIAALLVFCLPGSGSAYPITIDLTAAVSDVDDPGGYLGGAVHPGSLVQGRYCYDTNATDTNPLPTVGDYWYNAPPSGLSLEVEGLHFYTDPGNVNFLLELCNDHIGSDNYLLRSYNNVFDISVPTQPGDWLDNHLSWQLDDPTMTALSNTDLPVVPPYLPDWQSIFGLTISSVNYGTYERFLVRAHVSDVRLVPPPVPEPATAALLVPGLLVIAALARRRVRS